MKRTALFPIVGVLAIAGGLACWVVIRHHFRQEAGSQRGVILDGRNVFGPQGAAMDAKEACRQRGVLLDASVQLLERAAKAKLRIGSNRDSVIRFLDDNGFTPEFIQNDIQGTVFTTGCAPPGCGSDAALMGVRVEVNERGIVVSEPVVVAMYTSCA